MMNLRLIYSSILLCIGLQATGQQANTLISGKQPNHVMADSLDVHVREGLEYPLGDFWIENFEI